MNVLTKPATDIQYVGLPGLSASCKEAVMRIIQFGDRITSASILTADTTHCLLLRMENGDLVAIRSGFGSGYNGEGSRAFSFVLSLLHACGAEIDEYEVDGKILDRIDSSSLTARDIDKLEGLRPVRPVRWYEYTSEADFRRTQHHTLWKELPPVMPYAIIDSRIMDLALGFFEQPDHILMSGFRRLEDVVRQRTGLSEHGTKLFAQAFHGEKGKLTWEVSDTNEAGCRGELFKATYGAYRNPRAHRTQKQTIHDQLAEFLQLNHLFRLEHDAVEKKQPTP